MCLVQKVCLVLKEKMSTKNVDKKERKEVVAPVKVLVLLWLLDIKLEVGLSCRLQVVL